jgi:sarcosine oxidase subunit alpha
MWLIKLTEGLNHKKQKVTSMTNRLRLISHPVLGGAADGRATIAITVDGRPLQALEGETLAAALWANGIIRLSHDPDTGGPRGMYCGIGHCYECRVTVDGMPDVRSCLIPVRDGMCVTLQKKDPGNGHDD